MLVQVHASRDLAIRHQGQGGLEERDAVTAARVIGESERAVVVGLAAIELVLVGGGVALRGRLLVIGARIGECTTGSEGAGNCEQPERLSEEGHLGDAWSCGLGGGFGNERPTGSQLVTHLGRNSSQSNSK